MENHGLLFRRATICLTVAMMVAFPFVPQSAFSGTPGIPGARVASGVTSNLISDDFNDAVLNTGLWTFVNPLADAQVTMNGSEVKISVPGGTVHDAWTGGNNVPRILQPTIDADFQLIVKIDSPMSQQYQTSGILIQESPSTYLRFDVHSDGTNVKAFAASISNNLATAQTSDNVIVDSNGVVPIYIAILRSGNGWQMSTSRNGSTWSLAASFNYALTVTAVGLFVGNQGTTPPAFTGAFDFFQTLIPKQPTLQLPANGAASLSLTPQLTWTAFPGAVTYRVQVGTDSTFATGLVVNDSTGVDSTRTLSGLAYATKYFWRVAARNASGATSAYTRPWSFTTIVAPPPTPALVAPATNTINAALTLTLKWRKSTGAAAYHLQAGTDSLFAGGFVVNDSTLTDTSRVLSGLVNEVRYFWRARALGPGGSSAFSSPWAFTTIVAAPGIPTLVSPPNAAIDVPLSTQLAWHPVPKAAQYRVTLGTDSTFASGVVLNDSTVTDSTRSVTGLTAGTVYFWKVTAKNIGGTSAPSAETKFTTVVGAPALVFPANGAGGQALSLTLLWHPVKSADRYWLQFGTDSTFATGLIKSDSTLTDTSRVIIGLVINQRYYWRVNARGTGTWGGFSGVFSFLTATPLSGPVDQISPANLAVLAVDSVKFLWHPTQPLIEAYDLEYGPDSLFVFAISDTNLVDTLKTVNNLISSRYFWRVRAKNPGGWGPFSSPVWSFRVQLGPDGVDNQGSLPKDYALDQNYPNPFNPSTMISFSLPRADRVRLEIFNVLGQKVATLVDADQPAGVHVVKFDGTQLSSGIYLYRLVAGHEGKMFVRKMVFAK